MKNNTCKSDDKGIMVRKNPKIVKKGMQVAHCTS